MKLILKGEVIDTKLTFTNEGTGLKGYVKASYEALVNTFGEPDIINGSYMTGYKVDAEWIMGTKFGAVTIYNYKDGKNYKGEKGLDIADITDWHIGGFDARVVGVIERALISK